MFEIYGISELDFNSNFAAWEELLTPQTRDKVLYESDLALKGIKDFNTVFEIQNKAKEQRFVSSRSKVERDSTGTPTLMYGINVDCTDDVKREQELERLANESRRND